MAFRITSSAFQNGQAIPARHTGDAEDFSPPLQWTDPPEATKSFALICDDPDAPGQSWVHWVLYDLPAGTRSLPENMAKTQSVLGSARQGMTDFRRIGYWGPAPPHGKPHRYFFRLYAVDRDLGLAAGASKKQVLQAIEGHVVGQTEIMGTYRR
jgi:Raf kinase inhibitor-like YbhB/YbcL family protein